MHHRSFRLRALRQFASLVLLLVCGAVVAGCRHAPVTVGQGADSFSGVVRGTRNPQVARYIVRVHSAAQVTIEFGPTTAYGLKTWTVSASPGDPATLFVAGMRAQTRYHMRALVRFADGTEVDDVDHTFRTGHYKLSMIPPITVQTNGTPQPGVELLNPVMRSCYQAIVTDLQGHVLWAYNYPDRQSAFDIQVHRYIHAAHLTLVKWWDWVKHLFGAKESGNPTLWDKSMWKPAPPDQRFTTIINPIKLLPNGNFIAVIGLIPEALTDSPDGAPPPHTTLALREFNLAGQTVRNLTMPALNRRLKAIGYKGPRIEMLTHDVTILPNGHLIVLGDGTREYHLLNYEGSPWVAGDILIELDQNFNPVWTWSEFDHLDVTRHPTDFPDWTHSNAALYTKDDGNLIVSMRTQNWIIKIDFANGKGSGKILWRLGVDGDLRLIGGQSPNGWPYGQHGPAIVGDRDAGIFDLAVMDNGYGRTTKDGKMCELKDLPGCTTDAVIYRIDENAKTATIVFRKVYPESQYSFFGGNVQSLGNDQMEVDLCAVGPHSDIYDYALSQGDDAAPLWHMQVDKTNVYRSERLGSLYPGVQW